MRNKIYCLILLFGALTSQAQNNRPQVPSLTLQECLTRGLENNYAIRMVKNRQQVSDNNATVANAGLLPTVDVSASYGGNLHTTRSTSRTTDVTTTERNALDGTLDAGIDLNWTIFDGFSIWSNY